MELALPVLNGLVQHTLRSLCSCSDSSNSTKWVYAVFWRILPRNYPPPKWDYGGTVMDRSQGNKRNWMLVWEDGFCDFYQCEQSGSGYVKGKFGADIFFKMSHEVYNYGEGLVGKVAADNSHKWVFRDSSLEKDPNLFSSWNGSIDPQPKAWDVQFKSGIQTIAIISVRDGLIQLGSLHKIGEDLNLVLNTQRKLSYLQSIPGVFSMHRSLLVPIQQGSKPNTQITTESHEATFLVDDKRHVMGGKRCYGERVDEFPSKSINLGYNSPQNSSGRGGVPFWSIPPLFPSISCNFGALFTTVPSVNPSQNSVQAFDINNDTCEEEKSKYLKPSSTLED